MTHKNIIQNYVDEKCIGNIKKKKYFILTLTINITKKLAILMLKMLLYNSYLYCKCEDKKLVHI